MNNGKDTSSVISKDIRRRTRRSFAWFGFYFTIVIAVILFLKYGPKKDEMSMPLRSISAFNEKIFNHFFSNKHLAKEYNKNDAVKNVRVNGDAGMGNDFKPGNWKLKLVPCMNSKDTILVSIDEIKKMPKTEIIFDFKCIEGWSQVTHWGGVRLSDFLKKYRVASKGYSPIMSADNSGMMEYVGLETPDKKYYVGIDMPSAMHPQTLLAYEMNGKPLPYNQGAPLRLIIPVKYGIKSIKRIGTMYFSDSRPRDYWAERGYDYYSGL